MKLGTKDVDIRKENLSNNILWFIEKYNILKTNFSNESDITFSTLQKIINKEIEPKPQTIEKICKFMKVSTDEIYFSNLPEIYDDELLRNFGNNFRRLVRGKKLPLVKISDDLKIPVSTVSQWFNSLTLPRPRYYDVISKYFKIPVSSLFCNDSEKDYTLVSIVKNIPEGREEELLRFASIYLDNVLV